MSRGHVTPQEQGRERSPASPLLAKRGAGISDGQRAALRRLVLARDKNVVATLTGSNAQAAYELAAELDSYIDELMTAAQRR